MVPSGSNSKAKAVAMEKAARLLKTASKSGYNDRSQKNTLSGNLSF